MGLLLPLSGTRHVEAPTVTSATEGTTVTASGSIHTKGSWAEVLASTAYDSYGITIMVGGTGLTATTNERALMDIGIGAASSEVVLIPDLLCGNIASLVSAVEGGALYHFPIFIAAGQRISARLQALIASDTATCQIWLHQHPMGPSGWVGSRVTAYGPSAATSSGVAHTHGNGSYAAATEIVASSTNPIRALQLGIDLGTDTTGNTKRGLVRVGVGATPNYVAEHLPFSESTTLETINFTRANFILSHMRFNIPSAQSLRVSAMMNAAGEARGFALYGVD